MDYVLRCTKCQTLAKDHTAFRCKKCNSILEVDLDYSTLVLPKNFRKERITDKKYAPFMPVESLSGGLGEGGTPLLAKNIPKYRRTNLLFKLETKNPTHSFKDRGSAVEITKAMEFGFDHVALASTGNMGISVAYYSKKAGIKATIFISKTGNPSKKRRIRALGAEIVEVNGDYNQALKKSEEFASSGKAFLCGDFHYRAEGTKSAAYEIIEQMKYCAPDFIFMPVGNATLISAVYKGLAEFKMLSFIDKMPKLVGVQSSGCDPIVRAYNRHEKIGYIKPSTIADAIAVGHPTFGPEALNVLKRTRGMAIRVTDSEITDAVRELKKYKIGAEPGGAAGFAGFTQVYHDYEKKLKGKKVVVIITGNN